MAITFDVRVTGEAIGRALGTDAEELAYALAELACLSGVELGGQVEGYLPHGMSAAVGRFLRDLAAVIDPVET